MKQNYHVIRIYPSGLFTNYISNQTDLWEMQNSEFDKLHVKKIYV